MKKFSAQVAPKVFLLNIALIYVLKVKYDITVVATLMTSRTDANTHAFYGHIYTNHAYKISEFLH